LPPQPPEHGGDLGAIRDLFPAAPRPWIDLSTGINPRPYPVRALPADSWRRLPAATDAAAVRAAAAAHYGVDAADLVLAPGSQALIQWLPRLRRPGRVAVLGPTYGEHAWSWTAAGHEVRDLPLDGRVPDDIDVLVVTRPNNPDGRIVPLAALAEWAGRLAQRGGWLVVDEAFADVSAAPSVAAAIASPALVALRSFGKFFGLAGCRLGAAIAREPLRGALCGALGPWCVPGPTLAVARRAFADRDWIDATRRRLARQAARLDRVAAGGGLALVGGTTLFRLYDSASAPDVFAALAASGILVRRFAHRPTWLRFGLPGPGAAEARLAGALSAAGPG
jgi:cobalamin biosynthetic protein CobC